MANEITTRTILSVANGNLNKTLINRQKKLNQSTARYNGGVLSIGTTHEAIPLGDVATPGHSEFWNLDGTNFIQLGIVVSGTFYPVIRMKADEDARFRIDPTATLYAKADAAPCDMDSAVLAD
jgi:hypothetical protein